MGKLAGQHADSGGAALGSGAEGILHPQAGAGQPIDVRRTNEAVAIRPLSRQPRSSPTKTMTLGREPVSAWARVALGRAPRAIISSTGAASGAKDLSILYVLHHEHTTHRPEHLPDQVGAWDCASRVDGGRLRPAVRPALDGRRRDGQDDLAAHAIPGWPWSADHRRRHPPDRDRRHARARAAAAPGSRPSRRRPPSGTTPAPPSGPGSGPRAGSPTCWRPIAAWSTCPRRRSGRPTRPTHPADTG